MTVKNINPISYLSGTDVEPIIRIYFELNHLKHLYREGWLRRNIPKEKCESVADHTFGVALLAYFLAKEFFPNLNLEKVLCMSLIHDFGEIYGPDITPSDNISKQDKYIIEKASVQTMFQKIPGGDKYISLWEEYEAYSSPEAKFVNQIDKLEMALQARIYEKQGYPNLQDFFPYTDERLVSEKLKSIFSQIIMIRSL